MKRINILKIILALCLLSGVLFPTGGAGASDSPRPATAGEVTAYDLILAMNSLRMSNGLPALVEDPIIDAVAQSTAQTMAASQMSWHIGDVSGRLAAAGFGGGSKVWATENFAVGNQTIDEIMLVWSDADHMLPATIAAYCNVGAGTAKAANGMTYYILQAAYTSGKACGEYTSSGTTSSQTGSGAGSSSGATSAPVVSQLIMPVKIATPGADGKIFHTVQAGQTFWAIAIAYKITIKDLKTWNNLAEGAVLKVGQKLFIPGSNTAGYSIPTQVGGIQLSKADASGKIIHVVEPYQTLSSIAAAYGTTVGAILRINSIQLDTPLQVGQKLIVKDGNPTPGPSLMPIQLLTPASDGLYYHTVKSGETLVWIAKLYSLPVSDLMTWNGLTSVSIIRPNQKLLLRVKPPATETPSPIPPTETAPAATSTASLATSPAPSPTPESGPTQGGDDTVLLVAGTLLLALAGLVAGLLLRSEKKRKKININIR